MCLFLCPESGRGGDLAGPELTRRYCSSEVALQLRRHASGGRGETATTVSFFCFVETKRENLKRKEFREHAPVAGFFATLLSVNELRRRGHVGVGGASEPGEQRDVFFGWKG